MKVHDYNKFKLFDYVQYWDGKTKKSDKFGLGDVVLNDEDEIGVIIQCHGRKEYRTDMFGNCCEDELTFASVEDVILLRPEIFNDLKL